MKLILVRHTETIGNKEKRYLGWTESKYTEKGKKDIRKIVEFLKDRKTDGIFSSPSERALFISKRLSEVIKADIQVTESIKEINFGIFDNRTNNEIVKEYPKQYNEWVKDYINYEIPDGESLKNMHQRVADFIDLLDKDDKKYIVVTHGGVIQSIITHVLKLPIEERWRFRIENGTIVELEYIDGYGVLNQIVNMT